MINYQYYKQTILLLDNSHIIRYCAIVISNDKTISCVLIQDYWCLILSGIFICCIMLNDYNIISIRLYVNNNYIILYEYMYRHTLSLLFIINTPQTLKIISIIIIIKILTTVVTIITRERKVIYNI